ncbi:glycosyltransferase family 2 protein [Chthonobacter albigriseus]|uniref:glycosyltransferase family 2 protein n=1 Tax=Chthonobacter albigriseus TaxID=1683161 RepID=UPI0015EEF5FB|nr:glycosyltransferase family A protein [Chthonobacter albigriseus]
MKFSLVTATYGRSSELELLFESLRKQTHRSFEVIVIDQNPDDRVGEVLRRFAGAFDVKHIRSAKGLSKARNVGLDHVDGDLVAFPDDDCRYPADLLERVAKAFREDAGLGGLCGMSVDDSGAPSQGRWATSAHRVDRSNIWSSATSYTIFLRRDAMVAAGKFDETLGVGAGTRWGAGEEVDFLLRVLKAGARVHYDPAVQVHHDDPTRDYTAAALARGRLYNRGLGRVLRLNGYPFGFACYLSGRSFARAAVSLARLDIPRARYAFVAGLGRLLGFADSVDKPGER